MGQGLQIKICIVLGCVMVGCTSCANSHQEDKPEKMSTEHISINGDVEIQDAGEETEGDAPESMDSDADTRRLEEMVYPYDCLEADDPLVQQLMEKGWEDGFFCHIPIKGLVGYSPESEPYGGLSGYHKDYEITIEKNVGKALLQSERLAEVKENMVEMLMDIIRERGENAVDYQAYFADEAMLQQIETYLKTGLEEDWILLESDYLSYYAGNDDEIAWYNKSETTWKDMENEITHRPTETPSHYNFEFLFFADYRTMGYGADQEAAELALNCAVSKETGFIEEIGISKWYLTKEGFETSRW